MNIKTRIKQFNYLTILAKGIPNSLSSINIYLSYSIGLVVNGMQIIVVYL